jgi:Family of unknown function (DUF5681)
MEQTIIPPGAVIEQPKRSKPIPSGLKPFKKGVSGNPSGRPKKDFDIDIKKLARSYAPQALEKLVEWANSKNPKASVAACSIILDRAYGKPTQQIDHGNANDRPLRFTLTLGRD